MSITEETAEEHKEDIAVLCCRREEGKVIGPGDLEDPNIIPELEASGLLELPENCLKIGEVLGGKLVETADSLTPLTSDLVEGTKKIEGDKEVEEKDEGVVDRESKEDKPSQEVIRETKGNIEIHIGEGKDIDLKIPVGVGDSRSVVSASEEGARKECSNVEEVEAKQEVTEEVKKMRELAKEYYEINKVQLGSETKIDGNTLYIREDICTDALEADNLVCSIELDIIKPEDYDQYSETLMDIQPIATKEEGELGQGTTRVIDGAVMVVTGVDENGVQIGEFGSSEGILKENIMWDRPGAPDNGDILIKTEVVIKEDTNMERPGPLAAHKATDVITNEIREALKEADQDLATNKEEFVHYKKSNRKKVVIIKEIMGQGAMHDNLILPEEPVGVLGGEPNVDLGNLPVVLSPLEVLDGGIHALTCIGPATKETSRHYWREPLVKEVLEDEELDLAGVILVGSPQANADKFYVSKRLGMLVEGMGVDGAFITTEGFGNNHIDFASHHEQVGKRDTPVVGMSFCAEQGALVVGNKYMKHMIDLNKSEGGIENEILANNTLCKEDAIRAISMLKNAIMGVEVKDPEPSYNHHVKESNLELIEEKTEAEIERVPNEEILPLSESQVD
ncbi:D-proline reductase (dithiol) proprotein PrdA [Sporohalobacter salinus]|uniref:D-proline reductase (dithiol) proprotein PrdA n=1 Tax=Sporohalobacter salinus TaxID=1494606 RepID=UPI0019616A78|nr:D-proline reductase (dithiol) proprotein PrdA [Sporohalobacter salinus]MBM7622532.1 D-proline reductase (dithiol) PrdA [Sporohalobacter salinus]